MNVRVLERWVELRCCSAQALVSLLTGGSPNKGLQIRGDLCIGPIGPSVRADIQKAETIVPNSPVILPMSTRFLRPR